MAAEPQPGNDDGGATRSDMHPRHEQTFPTLTPAEIARVRRFGTPKSYKAGELLFETGERAKGLFLLLSGHVCVTQRDGLGHVSPVVEQGPGQFLAEVSALSSGPTLVDGRAEDDVEAILVPSDRLHDLLVAEAELGERLMRAMILRRVSLLDSAAGGPVLIGPANDNGVTRLQSWLRRLGHPFQVLDPAGDEARDLIAAYAPNPGDLPLVITPDGQALKNPSETDLARAIGLRQAPDGCRVYDAVVVGAGPAGLATAVYAASEGLSIAVVDARSFGGQAGASARIENYFGFPTGISGQALTARAYVQAQKFGAEMFIPSGVDSLDCARPDGLLRLALHEGGALKSKAVIIASGARYRRPNIPDLAQFEGRGVWFWASPIEAKLCQNQDVVLVGGGNSAGQAAVYLSGFAKTVWMMVRSGGLAATMSKYLIDRIEGTPNIKLLTHTEVTSLEGGAEGLEKIHWKNRQSGEETVCETRNLFLFIGADPATEWLDGCGVAVDATGFVKTCEQLRTDVPGVFAVGDVRAGSVKRVGAAIGEGAQVVAALHRFLAEQETLQTQQAAE